MSNCTNRPKWSDHLVAEYPLMTEIITDTLYNIAHSEATERVKKQLIAEYIDELLRLSGRREPLTTDIGISETNNQQPITSDQ